MSFRGLADHQQNAILHGTPMYVDTITSTGGAAEPFSLEADTAYMVQFSINSWISFIEDPHPETEKLGVLRDERFVFVTKPDPSGLVSGSFVADDETSDSDMKVFRLE